MSHALFTLAIAAALLLSPALRICVDASGAEAIEIGETDCCDGMSALPKAVSLGEPDCIDEELSPLALIRHFDSKDLTGGGLAVLAARLSPFVDVRRCSLFRSAHEINAGGARLTVALRC